MSKVKLNEATLEALRLPELQAKYVEIVGEPTRCPNKAWLVRKILEAAKGRAAAKTEPTTVAKKVLSSDATASVEELQTRHLELVGRPTNSRNVGYLRWRLRQAERGRLRVGAEPRVPPHGADDILVLPLRMPAAIVERLDEARRRLGLASRAELFRRALHRYFVDSGEREVADFLLLRGDGGAGAGAVPMSEARS